MIFCTVPRRKIFAVALDRFALRRHVGTIKIGKPPVGVQATMLGIIFFPASHDDLGDKKETKVNSVVANALMLWRSRQDSNLRPSV
jgi:hypothetical protein